MVCKLQKHGDAHALVLDRATLEALGIDEHTPLEIEIDDGRMTVRRSKVGIDPEKFEASLKKIRAQYAGMLKRLAE